MVKKIPGNEPYFKRYSLKYHQEHDADIIEVLEASGNINGFIRDLIRTRLKEVKNVEI